MSREHLRLSNLTRGEVNSEQIDLVDHLDVILDLRYNLDSSEKKIIQ